MQDGTFQPVQAHILVIDQNRDSRKYFETILGWRGYRVTTAADGLDGLEKFRHGQFQLILTDLSTPLMSGWELGRLVKESDPSLPVALVNGFDFGLRPDHSPFDAIIPKPFHFEEFHLLVDELLQCKDQLET
jgi:CheY-like chemotaxis protein